MVSSDPCPTCIGRGSWEQEYIGSESSERGCVVHLYTHTMAVLFNLLYLVRIYVCTIQNSQLASYLKTTTGLKALCVLQQLLHT